MGLFQATGTAKIPAVNEWVLDKLNIQVCFFTKNFQLSLLLIHFYNVQKQTGRASKGDKNQDDDSDDSSVSMIVFAHHQDVLNALQHVLDVHKQDYMFLFSCLFF